MKLPSAIKTTLLLICLYIPFQSQAWGLLGHRIIGQIAESYLSKKAKKSIVEILGNESVAMSSNWPDFIKSDPAYKYLGNWHYVNLKQGLTQAEVINIIEKDTATNAYTKINWLKGQLKSGAGSPEDRKMHLRLLIHIVGDIHQPLHVGRPDDLGGNKIRVMWFNDPYNLHQIWDEVLVDFQQLSYTEYATAINFTTKEQRTSLNQQPMSQWFFESYQIAEKIYGDVKGTEEKLGFQYNFKYKATLEAQLLKGGVRLAGILNEIFG
ncbi:MAG: S1/P1 Nuclease [Sphingobacteriales bacterium]|nr:MAG: S1/P1 Nuclease [Sphingobacteriales bacterium]